MNTAYRPLQRSTTNRMLAGVCAGIGEQTNMDPTIVRLLAVLLFFLTGPGMLVAYLVLFSRNPLNSTSSGCRITSGMTVLFRDD